MRIVSGIRALVLILNTLVIILRKYNKQNKGVWGMPRLSEAKKDVISCEKLRGLAHTNRSADIRMGQPTMLKT